MKFMYTTTPDKHCHDFGNGIYGRPIFAGDQKAKLKDGWKFDEKQLPKAESKKAEEVKEVKSRDEIAESLGISLYDEEGKKRHYKLIQADIEAQNEHNES